MQAFQKLRIWSAGYKAPRGSHSSPRPTSTAQLFPPSNVNRGCRSKQPREPLEDDSHVIVIEESSHSCELTAQRPHKVGSLRGGALLASRT